MSVLEYKNYRKKSLSSGKKKAGFSRVGKKNRPKDSGARSKKFAAVVVASLILAAGVVFGGYRFFTSSEMFLIKSVELVNPEEVENLRLEGLFIMKGKNIFATSPEEIAKKLMNNPWVSAVTVRKVYPSRVFISVRKRRPVGMINLKGLYFIDGAGMPFKKVTKFDRKVFPVFTGFSKKLLGTERGKSALKKALLVRELIRTSKVRGRVSEINYRRGDGISIILKGSGLRVKLGIRDVQGALARLDANYDRVMAQAGRAGYVDLKYPGKIIVGEKKKI